MTGQDRTGRDWSLLANVPSYACRFSMGRYINPERIGYRFYGAWDGCLVNAGCGVLQGTESVKLKLHLDL